MFKIDSQPIMAQNCCIRCYMQSLLFIFHTTDGKAVVLVVVVAVHIGAVIVEAAVVRDVATVLGSTPEVRVVAEVVVVAEVAAGRNGRKSRGVVVALCVSNGTCCATCVPICR